ncbi:hypothetical protein CRG98_043009, partial [Punica granatum]
MYEREGKVPIKFTRSFVRTLRPRQRERQSHHPSQLLTGFTCLPTPIATNLRAPLQPASGWVQSQLFWVGGRSESPLTMDSCCVGLRARTHLPRASTGVKNGGVGLLGERVRGSLNQSVWVDQVARSLRDDESGRAKRKIKPGAASAIITSNNSPETLTVKAPVFPRQRADPKNVASIILGGGAGTHLFPLTRRAATPA